MVIYVLVLYNLFSPEKLLNILLFLSCMGLFDKSASSLEYVCSVSRAGEFNFLKLNKVLHVSQPLIVCLERDGETRTLQTAYQYLVDEYPTHIVTSFFEHGFKIDFKHVAKELSYGWWQQFKLLTIVDRSAQELVSHEEILSAVKSYRRMTLHDALMLTQEPETPLPNNVYYMKDYSPRAKKQGR